MSNTSNHIQLVLDKLNGALKIPVEEQANVPLYICLSETALRLETNLIQIVAGDRETSHIGHYFVVSYADFVRLASIGLPLEGLIQELKASNIEGKSAQEFFTLPPINTDAGWNFLEFKKIWTYLEAGSLKKKNANNHQAFVDNVVWADNRLFCLNLHAHKEILLPSNGVRLSLDKEVFSKAMSKFPTWKGAHLYLQYIEGGKAILLEYVSKEGLSIIRFPLLEHLSPETTFTLVELAAPLGEMVVHRSVLEDVIAAHSKSGTSAEHLAVELSADDGHYQYFRKGEAVSAVGVFMAEGTGCIRVDSKAIKDLLALSFTGYVRLAFNAETVEVSILDMPHITTFLNRRS